MGPGRDRLKDWGFVAFLFLLFLAPGAGLIVWGLSIYRQPPTARCPDLDAEDTEMGPSDICVTETADGEEVERRTYDEVLEDSQFLGMEEGDIFGIGVVIVGCAILLAPFVAVIWGALERRRAQAE
jgi:hypothetical protein